MPVPYITKGLKLHLCYTRNTLHTEAILFIKGREFSPSLIRSESQNDLVICSSSLKCCLSFEEVSWYVVSVSCACDDSSAIKFYVYLWILFNTVRSPTVLFDIILITLSKHVELILYFSSFAVKLDLTICHPVFVYIWKFSTCCGPCMFVPHQCPYA